MREIIFFSSSQITLWAIARYIYWGGQDFFDSSAARDNLGAKKVEAPQEMAIN